MIKEEINYWNSIKEYDKEITSVFIKKNKLTELLEKYPLAKEKKIADFGCGSGKSLKYISNFNKIYLIDISENLLKTLENNFNLKNTIVINSDIKIIKLPEKVDLILSINSIFPYNYIDFDIIIQNFLNNLKDNGEIIIVIPSFEAFTFLYQHEAENMFHNGANSIQIQEFIKSVINTFNYTPLGYTKINENNIRKYWLKEEIKYRLKKYKFKKINISKLYLDWELQLKRKDLSLYPKIWFWLIKIKK